MKPKIHLLFILASLVVLIHTSDFHPQKFVGNIPNQQTGNDRLGAVASENKVCSQIGIDLLKAGGNSVDAVGLSTCSSSLWLISDTACWNGSLHWGHWQDRLCERSFADADEAQIAITAVLEAGVSP